MERWLVAADISALREKLAEQQPWACPAAAVRMTELLTWETLDRVVRSHLPVDLVTVAGGRLVDVPPPRSLAEVRRLMGAGVSVVIRGSEVHDAQLGDLASAMGQLLPGEVHIQLYATPGGTNSYGWHYDFEDVFIAQTHGAKDYYFRENTVARHTVLGSQLDFAIFKSEQSPIYATHLLAGDWLYLPARWWHLVKCAEDSLSISIGVMSPAAFENAERVPAGWRGQ